MEKQFEIIAFDIDGTLTVSKQDLEDVPSVEGDMSDLLNKLLEKYKVAMISGASRKQFEKQILPHISKDPNLLKNLYLLPTNGSMICYFTDSWQSEAKEPFTEDEKKKIYDALEKTFEAVGFKPEKLYGELIEDRGQQVSFSALGQEAPPDLKATWDPDNKKRLAMLEVLHPLIPEFEARLGGMTTIDITRKGIDKEYGLKNLLNHLNLGGEKMLFIGDKLEEGGNDAPAKKVAGECRAVSSLEETKSVILSLLS